MKIKQRKIFLSIFILIFGMRLYIDTHALNINKDEECNMSIYMFMHHFITYLYIAMKRKYKVVKNEGYRNKNGIHYMGDG